MKRHAYLLAQAEVDTPGGDPRHKAELDDMFNKRVPQQVEADYRKLVPPDASKGWASKAFVCGANAGTIEHGQYDLDRFDPDVADYLRKRIAGAGKGGASPS